MSLLTPIEAPPSLTERAVAELRRDILTARLAPGETVSLARSLHIRDFTTRVHHPGRHVVEIMVNGEKLARAFFNLAPLRTPR